MRARRVTHPNPPPFSETGLPTSSHVTTKWGSHQGPIPGSGLCAPRSSSLVAVTVSLGTAQRARARPLEDLDSVSAVLCLMCSPHPRCLGFVFRKIRFRRPAPEARRPGPRERLWTCPADSAPGVFCVSAASLSPALTSCPSRSRCSINTGRINRRC